MRLIELEPQFLRLQTGPVYAHVASIQEADGISFLCPKCFKANGGNVGTHSVLCWFEGRVPDDLSPKPGRWNPKGTGFDDLSFVPGLQTRSVQLFGGCTAHFHITNGEVTEA